MKSIKFVTAGALICALMTLGACAKAPEKALSDAEKALLAASGRSECANEKYEAAEKLLAEARALVKKKDYDAAERKAIAAKRLADQAKAEGEANWEECQRRKNAVADAKKEPVKATDDTDVAKATLSKIYFAYDSDELTDSQRSTLEQNALWMRQNNDKSVTLEGHTDERGSVEYNLALGERRASTARRYLIQMGIDASKMRILSYGEEKPAAFGSSEEDFRQNRRVEFVPEAK